VPKTGWFYHPDSAPKGGNAAERLKVWNNHRGQRPPCCWLMSKFQSAKSPDQDKCLCTASTFSTTPQRAPRTKMKAAQSQSGLFALWNFLRHHNTAAAAPDGCLFMN